MTALVLRSLQAFAPAPQTAEYEQAVRGRRLAVSRATEEHRRPRVPAAGLTWAGASRADASAARDLIALQRDDGGWSQIPTLSSDAYATGQALTALAETGVWSRRSGLPVEGCGSSSGRSSKMVVVRPQPGPSDPALLRQRIPARSDQFISAAATNWATMALTWAVR